MKRIAIFCDGTWNQITGRQATHVLRLSQAVVPTAADGVTQIVFYQQGVGTGRGSNMLAKRVDKFLGGAFGWGLNDNLVEAYRQLVFWYEPGDEIFIFGFSRGAYTARSLGGLIRRVGIMPVDHLEQLPQAIAEYRRRDGPSRSDDPYFLHRRHQLSPRTATSQADLNWRRDKGDKDSYLLRLAYMGVFDTVGALGLPGFVGLAARLLNRKYQFHDTELSHMVQSARHAVAIDERRRFFRPTLWTNLAPLNVDATGMAAADASAPYQQKWFPGNHGVVGGSQNPAALTRCTARWISDGARERNLVFDRDRLQALIADEDPAAPAPGGFSPARFYALLPRLLADRKSPERFSDISEDAVERYRRVQTYRPGTLRPFERDLKG